MSRRRALGYLARATICPDVACIEELGRSKRRRFDRPRRGYVERAVIQVTHQPEAGPAAVVVVELEQESTTELARLLGTAMGTGEVGVIVDLGERRDASSELLTVLCRTARRLRELDGKLAVVSRKPELRRLFDLTLLSQGFDVYASRDEALRTWA